MLGYSNNFMCLQVELERLNEATEIINKYEVQLEVSFAGTLVSSF